jgi:type IV pilus assembly protein PilC
MALVITPRQLSHRAELYHQLSQLIDAGIGLPEALNILHRSPPVRSFRGALARLVASLHQGSTFSQALRSVEGWIPEFDTALLEAGERSGRLPECFKLLAQYYTDRAQLARQVISDLMYPVFLFHFAIFIGPFPELFLTGNIASYLSKTLGVLLPIYVVVAIGIFASQGRHGESWRAFIETTTRWVPFLGPARRSLALARLSAALEALINAGVPIIEAWELAAGASGSPALRRAVVRWRPQVLSGTTPAEAVQGAPIFPELFANMYNTGEMSGQLDDSLLRLQRYYQDQGSRQMRTFSQWTPKIIYFAIVLMIAYRIISFYVGYYGRDHRAMNEWAEFRRHTSRNFGGCWRELARGESTRARAR